MTDPSKLKILMVEDEEILRLVGGQLLRTLGYEVIVAKSGLEALELHQQNFFDGVILDMYMPDLNGDELWRRLRQRDPHLKVVLASGQKDEHLLGEMFAQGLAGFIAKPYTRSDLQEICQKAFAS